MDRGMGSMGGGGMGGSIDRGLDRMNDGQLGMGSGMRSMGGSGMSGNGMGGSGGSSNGGLGGPSNGSMGGSFGVPAPVGGGWAGQQQQSGGSSSLQARSDKIVVRGLSENCTWHTLKDRFSHAGDIKFAEMKDRGVGVIRFGTERDAERSVAMMNGQRIDGRMISVGLYL